MEPDEVYVQGILKHEDRETLRVVASRKGMSMSRFIGKLLSKHLEQYDRSTLLDPPRAPRDDTRSPSI